MPATEYKEEKIAVGPAGIDAKMPKYEVIEHKIGNQTNTEENNNKFFSLELIKNGDEWYCYSNYGRVDEKDYTGVAGLYGPDDEASMRKFFATKFASKVRPSKGYTEIQFIKAKVGSPKARLINHAISADEIPADKKKKLVESTTAATPTVPKVNIHKDVERLIAQWYRESSNAITSNSAVTITAAGLETPLGVLTFAQLDKGKTILGEIGSAVKDKKTEDIRKLTGTFFSNIPKKLGRKITDDDLIDTDDKIQQNLDLIDMMSDALNVGTKTFTSDIDIKYHELGIDAEFLNKTDPEWIRLEKKVRDTKGHNHYGTTTKVLNILRITAKADRNRYMFCNIPKETELWHGSRNINILGILKSGMKIAPPEAPRSGLAFGRGAYFADKSTKSLNYSLYPFPGVEKSKNCFLFVFNVKVGKQMEVYDGNGDEADICKKKGYDSVFAKEGKRLLHNEYIIPDVSQCTIQYIIELER